MNFHVPSWSRLHLCVFLIQSRAPGFHSGLNNNFLIILNWLPKFKHVKMLYESEFIASLEKSDYLATVVVHSHMEAISWNRVTSSPFEKIHYIHSPLSLLFPRVSLTPRLSFTCHPLLCLIVILFLLKGKIKWLQVSWNIFLYVLYSRCVSVQRRLLRSYLEQPCYRSLINIFFWPLRSFKLKELT